MTRDEGIKQYELCLKQLGPSQGVSQEEINEAIQDMRLWNESLNSLICRKCQGQLIRTLDLRQAGDSRVEGNWYNFNCLGCRDFFDVKM